jgi:hypothetical protein
VSAEFRCSVSSRLRQDSMAGTAPVDRALLFVEYAGSWGRDAPALLAEHIQVPGGVRAQLIRRHRDRGAQRGPDIVNVFVAWREGAAFRVQTTRLSGLAELAGLDLAALAEGRSPGLTPYDGPLWLVCTNGSRDVCCAETGRPVTAALAGVWPEQTWETTHLGGHRFSGTLLALPSGITLGRLDPASAVLGCTAIAAGHHPVEFSRGRAGWPGAVQAAELHLLAEVGPPLVLTGTTVLGDRTEVRFDRASAVVRTTSGPPVRQSCADLKTTPAPVHVVTRGLVSRS